MSNPQRKVNNAYKKQKKAHHKASYEMRKLKRGKRNVWTVKEN